jgi:hypothetical protein
MPSSLRTELADYLRLSGSILSMEQAAALAVRAWISADRARTLALNCEKAPESDSKSDLKSDLKSDSNCDSNSAGNSNSKSDSKSDSKSAVKSAVKGAANGATPANEARGYRWKTVFLPEGTVLRMESRGAAHNARVIGDQIIFRGAPVSPRALTLAVAGEGRNAWRDLLLKFPGERHWKRANFCRVELANALRQKAGSVREISAAAGLTARVSPSGLLAQAAAAMADVLNATLALSERATAPAPPKSERRLAKLRRQSDAFGEDCSFD